MNSTLALQKSQYEQEVGLFMGWGRGSAFGDTAWSPAQTTMIQTDVASGLRRFYYSGYAWSFLKPFATITLPEGATTLTLPDDFGGVDGGAKASLTNSTQFFLRWLDFTGPERVIEALAQLPNSTGITRMLAIRPVKAMPLGQMQKFELLWFPQTDQAYTLTFPYFITPNYLLDTTMPYAYGGVEHHETILEAALSVAEQRRDDMIGQHSAMFQQLLGKSMMIDRRQKPTNLGQNWDRSDAVPWEQRWNGHGWSNDGGGITINGIYYS